MEFMDNNFREEMVLEAVDQLAEMGCVSMDDLGKINPKLLKEPQLQPWVIETIYSLVDNQILELTPDRKLKRRK